MSRFATKLFNFEAIPTKAGATAQRIVVYNTDFTGSYPVDYYEVPEGRFSLPLGADFYGNWRDAGGYVEVVYEDKNGNEERVVLQPIDRES